MLQLGEEMRRNETAKLIDPFVRSLVASLELEQSWFRMPALQKAKYSYRLRQHDRC